MILRGDGLCVKGHSTCRPGLAGGTGARQRLLGVLGRGPVGGVRGSGLGIRGCKAELRTTAARGRSTSRASRRARRAADGRAGKTCGYSADEIDGAGQPGLNFGARNLQDALGQVGQLI